MLRSSLEPVRTIPPSELAVSLTQAKAHLRVTHTTEDSLIQVYLDSAIDRLDGWSGILGRCLVTQSWRQDLPIFADQMMLPFPNVSSVVVTYRDSANQAQTLLDTNYRLVNAQGGSWIEIAEGGSWPSTYDRPDAVSVTLTCGYGLAAAVPAALKAAILLHVGLQYTGRADGSFPQAYVDLVAPYRRVSV